jgi:adenylate cyclase
VTLTEDTVSDDDLQMLRYVAAVLQAGFAWAVGFPAMQTEQQLPRIALHYGVALFRDGDYYGRDINIASRVSARAAGGEVLVTRPVVEVAGGGGHLEFERIGEVTLKGFSESTEVFVARQRREESE